ncbi:MAG: hypothetical protein M3R14_11045 [Acidobacteriota bacterium]|nr:hypothetical protein [Acidobacteriota bacterium]
MPVNQRAAEQFNGREGETVTLFSRSLFTLSLRVGGFAYVISAVRLTAPILELFDDLLRIR